jgi:hypothetical protein
MSFLRAAAFQWVNPKAWVMAVGACTAYVLHPNIWINAAVMGEVRCDQPAQHHHVGGVWRRAAPLAGAAARVARVQCGDGAAAAGIVVADPRRPATRA